MMGSLLGLLRYRSIATFENEGLSILRLGVAACTLNSLHNYKQQVHTIVTPQLANKCKVP